LKEEGVGCTIVPPRVRMVTHAGISDEDIDTALTAWRRLAGSGRREEVHP